MSKKLIFAIALSLVLASGGLFSAQADCGLNPCGLNLNPCGWHFPSLCNINWNPCNWHFPSCGCGSNASSKAQDMNKAVATQVPQNQARSAY
jgi:hypothetical protein